MRVWLLSSGSSGNLALVEAEGERLLLDAGVGPRGAAVRMRSLGGELFSQAAPNGDPVGGGSPNGEPVSEKSALGIVVTHHHGDHVSHAVPLARALQAPLYMHAGVAAARVRRRAEVRPYSPGVTLRVGPFEVDALAVPHDAPQVALSVAAGGRRFGIVTDLGHVPLGLPAFLGRCDVALIEANYCPELLRVGPYPDKLKRRVGGAFGHLANEQTAELAASLRGTRLTRLWLGHISRVNNTVARALDVVRTRARGLAVDAVPHGVPCVLDVTPWPTQLALPLG